MAKQKMEFKIRVREIDNGFLVSLENPHGISWEERYCKDRIGITELIKTWAGRLFDDREKE